MELKVFIFSVEDKKHYVSTREQQLTANIGYILNVNADFKYVTAELHGSTSELKLFESSVAFIGYLSD